MDQLNENLDTLNTTTKTRTSNKKRKWREIEALRERYELKKELEDIDWSFDYGLEELNI